MVRKWHERSIGVARGGGDGKQQVKRIRKDGGGGTGEKTQFLQSCSCSTLIVVCVVRVRWVGG